MWKILLILITTIIYFLAPQQIDVTYILLCVISYLYFSVKILKIDKKNGDGVSFNLIFIAFLFICTFITPYVYIFSDLDTILFSSGIVPKYICKSCGLVQLALCVYYCGYGVVIKTNLRITKLECVISSSQSNILILISFLLFVWQMMINLGNTEPSSDFANGYTTTIIQALLYIVLLNNVIKQQYIVKGKPFIFLRNNFLLLSIFVCIIVGTLLIGDRTLPIFMALFLFAVFQDYIKKYNTLLLIGISIPILILFYIIGATRSGSYSYKEGGISSVMDYANEQSSKSQLGILVAVSDFMPSFITLNRALYISDRDDKYFHIPEKFIVILTSPIPFLPTITSELLLDKPVKETSSAYGITQDYREKVANTNSGMGTHVVGDIYYHWGIVGIYIFFFIFGTIIRISFIRRKTNVVFAIIYYSLFAYSLYMPRDTIFSAFSVISYQIIIFYFFKSVNKKIYENHVFRRSR